MIPWSPDLVVGFLIGLLLGVASMAGALSFALVRGAAWKEAALAQRQRHPQHSAEIIPFPETRR